MKTLAVGFYRLRVEDYARHPGEDDQQSLYYPSPCSTGLNPDAQGKPAPEISNPKSLNPKP